MVLTSSGTPVRESGRLKLVITPPVTTAVKSFVHRGPLMIVPAPSEKEKAAPVQRVGFVPRFLAFDTQMGPVMTTDGATE